MGWGEQQGKQRMRQTIPVKPQGYTCGSYCGFDAYSICNFKVESQLPGAFTEDRCEHAKVPHHQQVRGSDHRSSVKTLCFATSDGAAVWAPLPCLRTGRVQMYSHANNQQTASASKNDKSLAYIFEKPSASLKAAVFPRYALSLVCCFGSLLLWSASLQKFGYLDISTDQNEILITEVLFTVVTWTTKEEEPSSRCHPAQTVREKWAIRHVCC